MNPLINPSTEDLRNRGKQLLVIGLVIVLAYCLFLGFRGKWNTWRETSEGDTSMEVPMAQTLEPGKWSEVIVLVNKRVTTIPDSAPVEYQDSDTGRVVVVPPNSRDYPLGMATARIRSPERIKYIVERK